jgi:biopolymer transport protein ExbD
MSGVSVETGNRGGRRSLDSEINMIPMIDLLMVTISFLLITAVWSHMSRLNADAQVPGPTTGPTSDPIPKQLNVEMKSEGRFALVWKEGPAVLSSTEVSAHEVVVKEGSVRVVRYPELAEKVQAEWDRVGEHRAPSDPTFDRAVLHTSNDTPYASIVGVMDAVSAPHRPRAVGAKIESVPAFDLVFSVN